MTTENRDQADLLAMTEVVEGFLLENSDVVASVPALRHAAADFRRAKAAGEPVENLLVILRLRIDPVVEAMSQVETVFASGYKIARIVVDRSQFVPPELPEAGTGADPA